MDYNFGRMKPIILEKMRYCLTQHISKELIEDISFSDSMYDDIALRARVGIWKEDIAKEEHIIHIPATFFDHLLEDYKSNWFIDKIITKRGVNYKDIKVKFEKWALYPEFLYASEAGKPVIKYVVTEEKITEDEEYD